ncbi:hypothetical protein BYT27DRAFT_7225560 [Phlegmacium glaucopus]|nr:hypothetical protein BYT27DRAFT_7225560 [Phlegmacium glaucopus]
MGINFQNIFGLLTTRHSAVASTSSSKPARKSHRALSEPLPTNDDMDTASLPTFNVLRSQSKLVVKTMEEKPTLSQRLCPPSPAATEVDDPESQDIMDQIQIKGIKIQDFAYPSTSTPRLSPVPELFDQYKGLAEVEYRWSQSHRTFPIQGKTLSRLIDLGWIGQEELSARAAPMDLEELRKHNARQPMYPWKPFRWTTIPSMEERKEVTLARASYFHQWDRIRVDAEFQAMRRLRLERETEEVEEKMRERERQKTLALSRAKGKGKEVGNPSHKRRLEADDEDGDTMNTLSDGESQIFSEGGTEQKRRRLSEEPENLYPAFLIPSKQYPAPLHTYDPEIYPEAAYAIGSSSQSQPRPVVPPRTDTPPLSDDEHSPGRGTKLVHPKKGRALKRQLSRTQTYTQL